MPALNLINIAAAVQVLAIPPVVVTNLTGQGLRIDWTIEKSNSSAPDQAEITIYNLDLPFRKGLSKAMGLPLPILVSLQVGWDGQPENLFIGVAWKIIPEKRELTDVLTMFTVGAGVTEVRDTPPAGGSAVAIPFQLFFIQLVKRMGFTPSLAAIAEVASAAADLPVHVQTFQAVQASEPKDQLDELLATIGLRWGNDAGNFVIFKGGIRNDILPAILMPSTGLLTWQEQDDGGVQFTGLAQPSIAPGAQVQLLDELAVPIGGGPLRIESITFNGSTVGGMSTMDALARKVSILA